MSSTLLDIQGLRAVAVLLVVANHLTGWPHGGFVGVDVFFVISGFVITATLAKARRNTTNLREFLRHFYARRIRRLIPAALVTLFVTVAVAWVAFPAARAREITGDGLWAAFFSANWHFVAVDTDYFAAAGPASPFEHFWSLSVEEQFYVVWPLLLFAAIGTGVSAVGRSGAGRNCRAVGVVVGVSATSLAWAWFQTATSPVAAYFSTFTRAWELAAGALLALVLPRVRVPLRVAVTLSWVGLAAVAASALLVDSGTPFPAPGALPAVVGAALVVTGATASPAGVNALLRRRSAVVVGDASYAIYLVHLPAIVIVGAFLPEGGAYRVVAAALVVAGASVLLHTLVERPFLRGHGRAPSTRPRIRTDVVVAAGGVVLVGCSAVTLWPGDGEALAEKGRTVAAALAQAERTRAAGGADSAVGPRTEALQESLRSALMRTSWPALDPSIDDEAARQPVPAGLLTCGDITLRAATECSFGDRAATHTAYVLGDSTAMAYASAFRSVVGEIPGWRLRVAGAFGCSFSSVVFANADRADVDGCQAHNEAVLDEIDRVRPDVVFVTNTHTSRQTADTGREFSDAEWTAALDAELTRLPATTRVVLVEPAPAGPDARDCHTAGTSPVSCVYRVPAAQRSRAGAEAALAASRGWNHVDSDAWFCDIGTGYCPAFAGTVPVKHDTVHVSYAYDDVIAPALGEALTTKGVFS